MLRTGKIYVLKNVKKYIIIQKVVFRKKEAFCKIK